MTRRLFLLILLLGTAGCLRPLRTDSEVTFTRPVNLHLKAELEPKDRNPLTQMLVEGAGCCCRGPKVALVDVDGLLVNQNLTGPYSSGDNPVDLFRERLDAAAADPDVCAVVLRVNSPGGSVTATDIMWHELKSFREKTGRPVVACLLDHGCGGAYYLATAANLIVAHPTTVTGGIGVLLNLFNLEDALGVFNIVSQGIKAGRHIDMGSVLAALPPEAQRLLQQMADEFHQRFRDVVLKERPEVNAKEQTTFDGRVFTARQALQRKLIDRVGYLADATAAARQMAGQPGARVVVLHRCNDVARTPYAVTPHTPLQMSLFPVSIPGIERSRLPTFLYLWQIDPTLERVGGK